MPFLNTINLDENSQLFLSFVLWNCRKPQPGTQYRVVKNGRLDASQSDPCRSTECSSYWRGWLLPQPREGSNQKSCCKCVITSDAFFCKLLRLMWQLIEQHTRNAYSLKTFMRLLWLMEKPMWTKYLRYIGWQKNWAVRNN